MHKIHKSGFDNHIIYLILFLYAFAYMFLASTSSPLYPFNNVFDSNVYFAMGKGMFNGSVIYKDLFDHKGPLLYFIYGIGTLFSKTSFTGIYILESIGLWVGLFFGYKMALLYLNQKQALLAALLFPIFSLMPIINTAGSPEEFIAPFMVIGLYLYLSYFKKHISKHPPIYSFIHGILIMSVFLIKMNLIVMWVALLSAIFIQLLLKKEYKNLFINLMALVGGMVIVALPFIIYFLNTNSLNDFIDTYWKFNLLYAQEGDVSSTPGHSVVKNCLQLPINILLRAYYLIRTNPVTVVVVLAGIYSFGFKKYIANLTGRIGVVMSFLLIFFISYAQRGYEYYFIPICIYSILGCISILAVTDKIRGFALSAKNFALIICICLVIAFLRDKSNIIMLGNKPVFRDSFSNIINQEKDPTLLAINFEGSYLVSMAYNQLNIIPSVKYFYHPNISNRNFDIENTRIGYIKEKKCLFLCISSFSDSYIPPTFIRDNYEYAAQTKLLVSGMDGKYAYFYLYKRKE